MLLEYNNPWNVDIRANVQVNDRPPEQFGADLAIACHPLAAKLSLFSEKTEQSAAQQNGRVRGISAVDIARTLSQTTPAENGFITNFKGQGPFLNAYLDRT